MPRATLTALSSASWFVSARRVYRILKIVRIKMVEWEFSEEKSLITYSWETVSWVLAWPHKQNLQCPLTTVFYRSSHLVNIFQTKFNLTTLALPQLSVKKELSYMSSSYNLTLPGSHLHMFVKHRSNKKNKNNVLFTYQQNQLQLKPLNWHPWQEK